MLSRVVSKYRQIKISVIDWPVWALHTTRTYSIHTYTFIIESVSTLKLEATEPMNLHYPTVEMWERHSILFNVNTFFSSNILRMQWRWMEPGVYNYCPFIYPPNPAGRDFWVFIWTMNDHKIMIQSGGLLCPRTSSMSPSACIDLTGHLGQKQGCKSGGQGTGVNV